jgi:hypothetical protein
LGRVRFNISLPMTFRYWLPNSELRLRGLRVVFGPQKPSLLQNSSRSFLRC